MSVTTIAPGRTKAQRIADLFLEGYSLNIVAERGPSCGWTRADALTVLRDHGWTLDESGRIPRSHRREPEPQPAITTTPPAAPAIALPRWAAALIEGRKSTDARIKARADRIHDQLEQLAQALDADNAKRKMRERLAELDAERARLQTELRSKPTPADATAPRAVAATTKPINHGTWGGYLAHSRRGIPTCEPCQQASIGGPKRNTA